MSIKSAAGVSPERSANLHVVFGSGGSRAIIGGAGTVFAFHVLGLTKWLTVGGCSGGSIPALLLASGCDPKTALHLVIDTDFTGLLTAKANWLSRLMVLLMKFRYEQTLPAEGVYGWRKFEDFINQFSPNWPSNFWTVAAARDAQIVLTAGGAHKYQDGGRVRTLSPYSLPTPGTAVCATCAVPGVLDAVAFGDGYLFDGALSGDGQCPVDVVKRHYGAESNQIVAVDVGEDEIKKSRILRLLWKIFSFGKGAEIDGVHPEEKDGLVLVNPDVTGFHALNFSISQDNKWRAVITGFVAAVRRLQAAGIAGGEELDRALALVRSFELIQSTSYGRGTLSARVEALLRKQELY